MIETEYLIVIHCTHGVNRSGYMVARYLMDRLCVNAAEAIDTVSTVRKVNLRKVGLLTVSFLSKTHFSSKFPELTEL